MVRFFKLIDRPEFEELVKIGTQAMAAMQEKRTAFLDAWGSKHVLIVDGDRIVGLKDPREMDPPRELPKGWSKDRRNPGFVRPSPSMSTDAQAASKVLYDLTYPRHPEARVWFLKQIAEGSKECRERLQYKEGQMRWSGQTSEGYKMFWLGVYALEEHGVFVTVPDERLPVEPMEGFEEVPPWMFDKALWEFNRR